MSFIVSSAWSNFVPVSGQCELSDGGVRERVDQSDRDAPAPLVVPESLNCPVNLCGVLFPVGLGFARLPPVAVLVPHAAPYLCRVVTRGHPVLSGGFVPSLCGACLGVLHILSSSV